MYRLIHVIHGIRATLRLMLDKIEARKLIGNVEGYYVDVAVLKRVGRLSILSPTLLNPQISR